MKKLQLKKDVVTNLDNDQMWRLKGGTDQLTLPCLPKTEGICPRSSTDFMSGYENVCNTEQEQNSCFVCE